MSFESQWGLTLDRAATQLDEELRVVAGGKVRCCIALTASMYFREGHTLEARERLVAAWEAYRQAAGDSLIWGGDPKTSRAKKVRGTPILDVRSWMPRVSLRDAFEPAFHGGERKDDASPFQFMALAETLMAGELSSVTFALPLSWPARHEPGAYVRLVLDIASKLRPVHGYAGLGIALSLMESGSSDDMSYAVPLAKRFRGLELDFAHMQTRDVMDGIKGVNWLTILDESWVERLGGRDALAAALGTEIILHAYEGGLVIQAGPHPQFGDVNRAEPMPHYERVAAVLKPIRITELSPLAHWYGMDRERTAEWLRRFDR
jgi:hypothetical protein